MITKNGLPLPDHPEDQLLPLMPLLQPLTGTERSIAVNKETVESPALTMMTCMMTSTSNAIRINKEEPSAKTQMERNNSAELSEER